METCDTTMEHKKKEDTTIYVWGSTTEINTKRYTRRIMIMSLQSSFISHEGDKFDMSCSWNNSCEWRKQAKWRTCLILEEGWFPWTFGSTRPRKSSKPMSLDKACTCKSFKPKTIKLEGGVKHDRINIENCKTQEKYEYTRKYLENDCVSLHELLLTLDNIMERFDFSMRDTMTNTWMARKIFLERFNKDNLYNWNTIPIRTAKGNLIYVDFTSSHPYVMMANEIPVSESGKTNAWWKYDRIRHKLVRIHQV